ncbi:MAG: hypothetical protein QW756_07305 [Nitrososphaerota archaeon]
MELEQTKDKVIPVSRHYGVRGPDVLGLLTRGEEKEYGDIDILVEFGERKVYPAGLKIDLA